MTKKSLWACHMLGKIKVFLAIYVRTINEFVAGFAFKLSLFGDCVGSNIFSSTTLIKNPLNLLMHCLCVVL